MQVDDIDFDAFRDEPLDAATLRCLRYMHDVEHNTIIYLRDVLVTDAHLDHEITSFLTFWAFEEYFHGEAISQVLEAHGEPGSDARVPVVRRPTLHDRVLPLSHHGRHAPHPPGAHRPHDMGRGQRVDGAGGLRAPRRQGRPPHPVEAAAPDHEAGGSPHRLLRVAGHRSASRATAAPRRSPAGRCNASGLPVGAGIKDPAEVRFMARHLFGDDDGRKAAAAHRPLHRPPPRPGRPPPRRVPLGCSV